MKRNILICSLALFISIWSHSLKAQHIRWHCRPTLSWFTSDTKKFTSNGMIMGFNAGFAFERFFADRYAIQTGASMNNFGGNLKYNETGHQVTTRDDVYDIAENTSVKVKGQYISVPLGLKFKTNEIGYTTFYAHLGIKGNVRLKGYTWIEELNVDREVLDNKQIYLGFYHIPLAELNTFGRSSSIQVGAIFQRFDTRFNAGYGRVSIAPGLRLGIFFNNHICFNHENCPRSVRLHY